MFRVESRKANPKSRLCALLASLSLPLKSRLLSSLLSLLLGSSKKRQEGNFVFEFLLVPCLPISEKLPHVLSVHEAVCHVHIVTYVIILQEPGLKIGDSVELRSLKFSKSKGLQSGDFLRVQQIIYNDVTQEVRLRGLRLQRTKYHEQIFSCEYRKRCEKHRMLTTD